MALESIEPAGLLIMARKLHLAKVRKCSSIAKTGAIDVNFSELILLKTYPNPSALQFFDLLVKIIRKQ